MVNIRAYTKGKLGHYPTAGELGRETMPEETDRGEGGGDVCCRSRGRAFVYAVTDNFGRTISHVPPLPEAETGLFSQVSD